MIVCHCTGVTDRDIARLVEEGATTVREITRRCGAGRTCAPCRAGLQELLATCPVPLGTPLPAECPLAAPAVEAA
jgi:bacterioferritin-associated ferredoxin